MKRLTQLGSFSNMKILGQSKVKSFTKRLSHHTKVPKTSNYTILAIKELEATLETTLTSRGANNGARKIKDHEKHELA